MKKLIAMLLGLCLLLSGCGNAKSAETEPTTPPTETQPQATQPEETPAEPEKEAYMPGNTDFDWQNDYHQYGNFQFNSPPGNYLFYDGEVVFLHDPNHPYYSFDLTTGKVRIFCTKKNCDHENGNCTSLKFDIFGGIDQYDGILYDSSDRDLKKLQNGKWVELAKNVDQYWFYGEDLYVIDWRDTLQVYRGGTGEPETLMEDYEYYWNFVFDGYLYSGTYEELIRVDLNAETPSKELVLEDVCYRIDGDHIYYLDDETYFLYRCKMDGTNSVLLLDKPVLPAGMNFDDEYFYFRLYTGRYVDEGEDIHDIYRFPKSHPSKIEKIATLEEVVYQIYTVPKTGKIFVTTYTQGSMLKSSVYCMNTDGSNATKLEFPYQ